ncbi:MAG: bifunctional transaldolase/phosoglucose isomerase [Gammaproteobacteria bacterium]|nr:MAG: bifunctional transaldolase/phosoglucose isomerase [Gammaproteobacteria bacterium]
MNPLKQLGEYGQSVWFDYLRRNLLTGSELDRLIEEDGLTGITFNPDILEKAIASSTDYTTALQALGGCHGLDIEEACEHLVLDDIRDAALRLAPVYSATAARDGYVSLEISPRLANDTAQTIAEARRLWKVLDLPNVMIKVPATDAGLPAIESLLGQGINVNATLLFTAERYARVVEAYLRALEHRAANGLELSGVASVASFFVSRIDSVVDGIIRKRLAGCDDPHEQEQLERIQGQVAIACAKLLYRRYRDTFDSIRWQKLANRGARPQRLLWTSTGVKNPTYRDVHYSEELIGPDTVNAMQPATMYAFRNHGVPRASIEEDLEAAHSVLETLDQLGISLEKITDRLLDNGVQRFVIAFDKLLHTVQQGLATAAAKHIDGTGHILPEPLGKAVQQELDDWQRQDKVRRLWSRDATLWTGRDEARWMDWLGVTSEQLEHLGDLRLLSQRVENHHFKHCVLLGMGGSSMAPEVIHATLGHAPEHPEFHVLDSTDPAQIRAVEAAIDLEHSLFLVASKSGSTLEPNILTAYFFQRTVDTLGAELAPTRFMAITDPGSDLERLAREAGYRQIFHGIPGIGGRFSALSNFGIVPAAIMGVDVERLLDNAMAMVEACAACVPARDNPGVVLGCILGVAARMGRDKLTLVASPGIATIGAWLEQLVAESTGKQGKGIIPVDGEGLGAPEEYGEDRLFVYLRLEHGADAEQDAAVEKLQQAGLPVVHLCISDTTNLGQEFFRWEIATAVAGSILGIHPFDQPDVEASKVETRKLTAAYESSGQLPVETPLVEIPGLAVYTDAHNATALYQQVGSRATVGELLVAHFARICPGDYVALLAYLARNDAHDRYLQAMRRQLRACFGVATCAGFGPRFLHSTGQAYKGGPNSGVFLQITCEEARDLPVPRHGYTFGIVKAAQARGDFEVLTERGRRALRVHLGTDTEQGLQQLAQLVKEACAT